MSPSLPILDFLKRFRTLAYLLVFLSITAFAYSENNSSTFILGLAGILLSWLIVESPRGRAVPRWIINLGVLSAAAMLFYELAIKDDNSINLLRSLGHFMIIILVCKLFERKNNRDYAQILTLTLLVIVAAAITSLSFFFAIILALYLAAGLYTMLLFHLRSEIASVVAAKIVPSEQELFLKPDPSIRKDFRRAASLAALILIALATLVFLVFPRSRSSDLFGGWNGSGNYRSGFSDRVKLYDEGHLQLTEDVVMEVKIEEDGVNSGAEDIQPYFRGMTLDTYDPNQHQWIRSSSLDTDEERSTFEISAEDPDVDLIPPSQYQKIGLKTQQYTLYAPSANVLFTISPAVHLHADVHMADRPMGGTYSEDDPTLLVFNNAVPPIHYSITSALIFTPSKAPPKSFTVPADIGPLDDEFFPENYNHVPFEVRRLAYDIAHGLLPPPGKPIPDQSVRAIADRFQNYLQQNYPYSLEFSSVNPDLDPTTDFLLNRKATGGHCEFFASAMVMLCRSVGINARMVIGYHGGDFNSLGGYYAVKQKYAHAWTEVVIPGHGWVTFDPSPISSIGYSSTNSMTGVISRWFHDLFDIIQKNWQATVIAFDNSSRTYLFTLVTAFFSEIVHDITYYVDDFLLGFRDLFATDTSFANRIAALTSTSIILGLIIWLLRHWHRRRNSQVEHILRKVDRKAQRQLAHDLLFFDDLLRLLGKTGCRKMPEQTPSEYVDRLGPALGAASPDAKWLVATFYDIRFGALRLTPSLRERIAGSLQQLRQHFHHHTA